MLTDPGAAKTPRIRDHDWPRSPGRPRRIGRTATVPGHCLRGPPDRQHYISSVGIAIVSLSFADRMRSTRTTAMVLGLLVFLLFIPAILIPIVGIAVWLILGPYFGARTALREHRERAISYAALLGTVEAALVASSVLLLLHVIRGNVFLATLEWITVSAMFVMCIVFSVIGAWTLPE